MAQGCIRKGGGSEGERGGVGWDPPPPQGAPIVPAKGGPKGFTLNPLGTEAAPNIGRGRGGGGLGEGWRGVQGGIAPLPPTPPPPCISYANVHF